MRTNQLYCWLLGLSLGLIAIPGLGVSAPLLSMSRLTPGWVADSDQDGVEDEQDLCPGTTLGTVVNAYGCPMEVAQCDYSTSTIALKTQGGTTGVGINTRYVLSSNTGTIVQVQNTPTFTGLSSSATYMVLALTYEGAVTNLTVGTSLSAVSASCLNWSQALVIRVCVMADADQDGVPDTTDLCPGTPAGTVVNAYGCPMEVAQCDYSTSTVTLKTQGGTTGVGINTRYVLTTNTGTILQISPTASFTGLTGSATYMAVAVTYEGTADNLTLGSALSAVSASCLDRSDALVFKACIDPAVSCDYQVGETIVLRASGGSVGAGVQTRYVLTDSAGKLVSLSTTPSFASGALVAGTYRAYALTYSDDNSVVNLAVNGINTLSQVTASCLVRSEAYPITLCGDCQTPCVPIFIVRIRR